MAKLRCRAGDTVLILTGLDKGKLGVVKRAANAGEIQDFPAVHWYVRSLGSKFHTWTVTRRKSRAMAFVCPDGDLMPPRDRGGQDEMLRIAGKWWETQKC